MHFLSFGHLVSEIDTLKQSVWINLLHWNSVQTGTRKKIIHRIWFLPTSGISSCGICRHPLDFTFTVTLRGRPHWQSPVHDKDLIHKMYFLPTLFNFSLLGLQSYFRDGRMLTATELRRITDIFTKMFMDAHTKVNIQPSCVESPIYSPKCSWTLY